MFNAPHTLGVHFPSFRRNEKVSRREFLRHSDAWSKAVLEAELLYETSLEPDTDGGGARQHQHQNQNQHQQPQRQRQQQPQRQHPFTNSEDTLGSTRTAATATEATATATANSLEEKQATGNTTTVGDAGGSHVGSTNGRREHPSGTVASRGRDDVGTFLNRRVREILRAGTGGGGSQGGGEGEGEVDEGTLGYLLRKQYAVEGCDDLNSVSTSGYGTYEELGGGDVRVPGGFSRVVDALAGKVSPLLL